MTEYHKTTSYNNCDQFIGAARFILKTFSIYIFFLYQHLHMYINIKTYCKHTRYEKHKNLVFLFLTEASLWRCDKMITPVPGSAFNKVADLSPQHRFSCEFCEIF